MDTDTGTQRIEEAKTDGTDNDGKILFAAVQSDAGVYAAVIYDADASNGGGGGDATITVTCNAVDCDASAFVVAVNPTSTAA